MLQVSAARNYGRREFAVAGPAAWNSLSDELRVSARSYTQHWQYCCFRHLLKTRLFSEY